MLGPRAALVRHRKPLLRCIEQLLRNAGIAQGGHGARRHRQIACGMHPLFLHLGPQHETGETGGQLVFILLVSGQDPQPGAVGQDVGRLRRIDVVIVGQGQNADVYSGTAGLGVKGGLAGQHGALAAEEAPVALASRPRVVEVATLLPACQQRQMLDVDHAVDQNLVHIADPACHRFAGLGRNILGVNPGKPCAGQRTFSAVVVYLPGNLLQLPPGLDRLIRVEPGLAQAGAIGE